ncbi:hypothetical protein SS50377_23551 [Spironucleus salmonicida]|uniref:Uncharacterized protein n=1 Tax=Spironucleus salmonicida TaxID=348837 RepID=V6LWA9_9EUKA|nr:hypothetical protein SS50377_23551 [Spironucleus salmonicida]|eukprot:EST48533.1 hypothetical protein SS50377_11143 [Spironucleus salmonicida]
METQPVSQLNLYAANDVQAGHFFSGRAFCSLDGQILRTFPSEIQCFTCFQSSFFICYEGFIAVFQQFQDPVIYEVPHDCTPVAISVSSNYIALLTDFPNIVLNIFALQISSLLKLQQVSIPFTGRQRQRSQLLTIQSNFLVSFESESYQILLQQIAPYWYCDVCPIMPEQFTKTLEFEIEDEEEINIDKWSDQKQTQYIKDSTNYESVQLEDNLQYLQQTTASHLVFQKDKDKELQVLQNYVDPNKNSVEDQVMFGHQIKVSSNSDLALENIINQQFSIEKTDSRAFCEMLNEHQIQNFGKVMKIQISLVFNETFIIVDQYFGIIVIPLLIPPKSVANILHPKKSLSYILDMQYNGLLTAFSAPSTFGYSNGYVQHHNLFYQGSSSCKYIFNNNDKKIIVFNESIGYINDKCEFEILQQLQDFQYCPVSGNYPEFMKYVSTQQLSVKNLQSPKSDLSGRVNNHKSVISYLSEQEIPDPVLCSCVFEHFIFTGHSSGNMRVFVDYQNQTRLIQKLRLSSVGLLKISGNTNQIVVSDAFGIVYFISGVEKEFIVLGHIQIGELGGVSAGVKTFLEECDQQDTGIINIQKQQLCQQGQLIGSIIKPKQVSSESTKQYYFQNIDLKEIQPLTTPFVENGIFYSITCIRICNSYAYISVSNGNIYKLFFPSSERVLTQIENSNVLRLQDFLETLTSSSQRELEMLENRYLSMTQQNQINIADLKPQILKTQLAISTLFVDECVVPPPLVLSDLIYAGLSDGRVFVFMVKTDYEQTIQSVKLDFPLISKEIVKMSSKVEQIEVLNGVVAITDSFGQLIFTQAVSPQLNYLKKISQVWAKNDDVVQSLVSGEVLVNEVVIIDQSNQINSKQNQIPVYQDDTSVQIQLLRNEPHYFILSTEKDTIFVDVQSCQNETYRIRVPAQFTAQCQTIIEQIDQFVKGFVIQTLQTQSAQADGTQISKQQLKLNFEKRVQVRQPKQDQNIIQLLLSIQTMDETGIQHPYSQILNQKFSYREKVPLQYYDESSIAENLKNNIQNRISAMSLKTYSGSLEVPFQKVPRLISLVISSNLRLRINQKLIEESQKIAESLKEIDNTNMNVLAEKNLTIISKTSTIPRIKALITETDPVEDTEPSKILKSTQYLDENVIHVSDQIVNASRVKFFEKFGQYEKAYKSDILKVKTFQYFQESMILQNSAEAVSGLLDKKSYVPGFAYKPQQVPKQNIMLRTTQLACELFAKYSPPVSVKNGIGKYAFPNETVNRTRNTDVFSKIQSVQQSENSGTLNSVQSYSVSLPEIETIWVEQGGSLFDKNIALIPQVKEFILPQASISASIYQETQVTAQIRARQQALLYRHQAASVCSETNQSLTKIRDQKFRNINKISEIVQSIKEIGKELTYHAKEETLTKLIEQERQNLYEHYLSQGLAQEECCSRAAKNAISQLPSDEVIAEKAMELIDFSLLDFSLLISQVEQVTRNENVEKAIKYDLFNIENQTNELRKISNQSQLEKTALNLMSQIKDIIYNEVPEPLLIQLQSLTNNKLFHIQNLPTLLSTEIKKITQTNQNISERVLRLAAAYKRAIYEMMRGSIDASNQLTIRDVIIPPALGVTKLNKEQEAVVSAYNIKLQEIEERRNKEKKQLAAQCIKYREQAEDLCKQFDNVVIKQFRDKRFKDEILVQSYQLQSSTLLNYSIQKYKFKQFQEINDQKNTEMQVCWKELGNHLRIVEDGLKGSSEKLQTIRNFSRYIDQNRKTIFQNPDLQKFFQSFKINYQAVKDQIKQQFNKLVIQKAGLSYSQIIGSLEIIFNTCQFFDKEILHENYQQIQQNEMELLDKFAENLTILNSFEPLIPQQSPIVNLNSILSKPIVYNAYYIQLISKLFPIQQLPDFAQQTTKPNFQSPEMILFDVCRCCKTLLELQQTEAYQKLQIYNNFNVYSQYLENSYQNLIEENSQAQLQNIQVVNRQFLNPSLLCMFKLGQLELYRDWDSYFDTKKLRFLSKDVIEQETDQEDVLHNLLIKDDSQFVIIDLEFLKNLNNSLTQLGQQRVNKLSSLAKFRQKQEILSHEIEILQFNQEDYQAQTKSFQLIRVSKDMHDMIRENMSISNKKAREVGVMQRKLEHARKSHQLTEQDQEVKLSKIPYDLQKVLTTNEVMKAKIEEITAQNEQRRQALPEFTAQDQVQDEDKDDALKKFRRIAALRKMRELSKAQEEEMQFLIGELDKLRKRTYPSFQ